MPIPMNAPREGSSGWDWSARHGGRRLGWILRLWFGCRATDNQGYRLLRWGRFRGGQLDRDVLSWDRVLTGSIGRRLTGGMACGCLDGTEQIVSEEFQGEGSALFMRNLFLLDHQRDVLKQGNLVMGHAASFKHKEHTGFSQEARSGRRNA